MSRKAKKQQEQKQPRRTRRARRSNGAATRAVTVQISESLASQLLSEGLARRLEALLS